MSPGTMWIDSAEDIETRRIQVRDAVLHRDGARVDNVRLRYHSATLPASVGAAAPGRHKALELELAEPFDAAAPGQTAVLMDGEMPEMDGFDATRQIRRREAASHTRVPIIAMTASAMVGDRERFIDAGMDEYITKPISLERLRDVLLAAVQPPS